MHVIKASETLRQGFMSSEFQTLLGYYRVKSYFRTGKARSER